MLTIIITRYCASRRILFSLCVCVLLCDPQFFNNYFCNWKQKYANWTNEKGEKRTLMSVAGPNVGMPTSLFPNDTVNIILLENQIIKGRLAFGKIKTDSEDRAAGCSLQNYNRGRSSFQTIPESRVDSPHQCVPSRKEKTGGASHTTQEAHQKGQAQKEKTLESSSTLPGTQGSPPRHLS